MGLMTAGGGLTNSKLKLATAAESEVLSGETFYAGGKDLKTGSMPNHGAWGTTISPGGSVTIPQGYHNGSGKVQASSEKVQVVQINQPPVGNERRNGSGTVRARGTIKSIPEWNYDVYGGDGSNRIQITGFSGNAINYNWWVHNSGIRAYVAVILA